MTHVLFHRGGVPHPAPAGDGEVLRRIALWLAEATVGVFTLWVIGESLADPGGWAGVALVSLWLVPMVGLTVLAWRLPGAGAPVLAAVTAAFVALSLAAAVWRDWWHDLQQDRGPVLVVVGLALAAPLAALAFHRPRLGGALLCTAGLVPVVLGVVVRTSGAAALGVVSPPLVVCGALFLLAAGRRPDHR